MQTLYASYTLLGREKLQLLKEKIELEEQNDHLKKLLVEEQEKTKLHTSLVEQNENLSQQLQNERDNSKVLEVELAETMKKVKMLNSGTKDLNEILTIGRTSKSSYGLGYDGTNVNNKMMFVKASTSQHEKEVERPKMVSRERGRAGHQDEVLDKPHNNSQGRRQVQNDGRCYFCGKYGHFKRTCYHYHKKIQKLLRERRYSANMNRNFQVWIRKEDLYGAATRVTVNTQAKCGNNLYLWEQKDVNLKAKNKTNDEGNVVRNMHPLRTHEL